MVSKSPRSTIETVNIINRFLVESSTELSHELRLYEDLTMSRSDNELGVFVMGKHDYITKVQSFLESHMSGQEFARKQYTCLTRSPNITERRIHK